MLATELRSVPIGDRFSFEVKFDGIRAALTLDVQGMCFTSRRGTNITGWFPELASIADHFTVDEVMLDGEIIAGDGSIPTFNDLLRRSRSRGKCRPTAEDLPLTYVPFDVLRIGSADQRQLPLSDRRLALASIVRESPQIAVSRVFADGVALYAAAVDNGLEGIVGKVSSSAYTAGRSRDWVKIKVPGASLGHEWRSR